MLFKRKCIRCGHFPTKFLKRFKENTLIILTILGVLAGFIIGHGVRNMKPSSDALVWLGLPGDVFLRLLKMFIVPLIIANIIIVISTLDPKENGKIGLVAFSFITCSNLTAAVSGVAMSLIIKPGYNKIQTSKSPIRNFITSQSQKSSDMFVDMLFNLFPDNLIGINIFKTQTLYRSNSQHEITENETIFEKLTENIFGVNMLGIIFCSFIFGLAAGNVGEDGRPFLNFFRSVISILFWIMNKLLLLTPIGVCFMIAKSIASIDDMNNAFSNLGMFSATVIAGLLVHMSLMLFGYLVLARANPLRMAPYCFKTWLISFTTLSPIVAIPDMCAASDAYGIDPRISRFVVPLTATLKGDGSAVFIAAATIFLAQLSNTVISSGNIVMICFLSAASVFAVPNVPSSSIILIITIMSSLGVPTENVGLLFALEWLLDRLRTSNIGILHMYCVGFTHHICYKTSGMELKIPTITDLSSTSEQKLKTLSREASNETTNSLLDIESI